MIRENSQVEDPLGGKYRCGDRGGMTRSSDEAPVTGVERRGCVIWFCKFSQLEIGGAKVCKTKPLSSSQTGRTMAGKNCKARATAICSLVDGNITNGLDNGSRMSREAHVRF